MNTSDQFYLGTTGENIETPQRVSQYGMRLVWVRIASNFRRFGSDESGLNPSQRPHIGHRTLVIEFSTLQCPDASALDLGLALLIAALIPLHIAVFYAAIWVHLILNPMQRLLPDINESFVCKDSCEHYDFHAQCGL